MTPAAALLIEELRQRGHRAADEAVRRNGHAFAGLTEADHLRTEAVAHAVAMRLLEDALYRLGSLEAEGDEFDLGVVRELFGLSDAEAPPAGRAARAS